MDRRFERRKRQLLSDCKISSGWLGGAVDRLAGFVSPFAARLTDPAQRQHAREYCQGLVSNVERKNVEAIAYQHDQDRRALQHFIGTSPWNHTPLLDELCGQVADALQEPDGVLVLDPSSFPKCGKKSVGVARQWCGRLGKIENCQVGVYLAYVSRTEQALVDFRLYLPKAWTKDRVRRKVAGVPRDVKFQTRHALALEMIQQRGGILPHRWVAADDEFGKAGTFRRELHERKETYLLAVPGNLTVRVLPGAELPCRGQKGVAAFERLDVLCRHLPASAWRRIDLRDGEKGPLVYAVAVIPHVQARSESRPMQYVETAVFIRYTDSDGTHHEDYYLSDAPADTPRGEFLRVACAEKRVEECFRRGKSETGLADYEVRNWLGWHHHQTLSLLAMWFLVQETRRGKKIHAGHDGIIRTEDNCPIAACGLERLASELDSPTLTAPIAA